MSKRKENENRFLNELVKDCITYRLKESEALEYIQKRFGQPIGARSYQLRKARLQSESSAMVWYEWFTRVGFVHHHQEQVDAIEKIQQSSMATLKYLLEAEPEKRNYQLIRLYQKEVRLNSKLLSELGLGTPIIASVKKKLDEMHEKLSNQNIRQPGNQILP